MGPNQAPITQRGYAATVVASATSVVRPSVELVEPLVTENNRDNSCRGRTYVNVDRNVPPRPPALVGSPHCLANMVFIPRGWRAFNVRPGECPEKGDIEVPPFCLDQNEIAAGEYTACVGAGVCHPVSACHPKEGSNPRLSEICARFIDAETYCTWRGLRLPSADEWLRAATNGDGRIFPWGNDIDTPETCSCREYDDGPCETVRDTEDMSFHGVRDLAANASEWVTPHYCIGNDWKDYWPPRIRPASCWGTTEVLSPNFETGNPPCGFRCASDPLMLPE
jgi:formylglycine-generating enzyme required for sulfatase activity